MIESNERKKNVIGQTKCKTNETKTKEKSGKKFDWKKEA